MTKLVLTRKAKIDVFNLLDYLLRQAGSITALEYDESLESFYGLIRAHPEICPASPQYGQNVRMGIVRPYLVFYNFDDANDTVTILRVIHGKRQITAKLLSGT